MNATEPRLRAPTAAARTKVRGARRGLVTAVCAGVLVGSFACTRTSETHTIDLAGLVSRQQDFAGDEVRTSGTVTRFVDAAGTYYVLQDAQQDRVELLPPSKAGAFDGRTVTVTGRFHVSSSIGRFIRVELIKPGAPGEDR
jgi:hypothetical protein